MTRRAFLALSFASQLGAALRPITISVQVMFDRGAHAGQGLSQSEIATFWSHQEKARREFAISGITFNVHIVLFGISVPTTCYAVPSTPTFSTTTIS